jgi:tetratricopeptide (TPR) repeat protein
LKTRGTEASGTAAVAISGDAHQPVLTNPKFFNIIVPETDSAPPARLRLLPPDIPDFVGRQAEIELLGISPPAINPCTRPVRSVITGKPGVGKSALAIHASYLVSDTYADGDLYVDLRGADENPASPEEVMGRFMRSLGIPEEDIPSDPSARLDSYRKAVADRPLVIVLDNASDERQVRPLIPPGNSSFVLITSRSQLRGLEGFRRIDLEVFPSSMSLDFLRRVTGEDVVEAEQASAEKVIEACGHLPLALRIAANRLTSTRNMRMSHLAQELTDMRDILGALEAGDLAVRAAFNLSYRKLGKGARNAFKRLSCVPGEDFGPGLCSSLMRCDERQAGKLLSKLAEANLIEHSATYGRYRFHDLLRVYAQKKFDEDDARKKSQAIQCMLGWLKDSAVKAQFSLIGRAGAQFYLENAADIGSVESATAWAREELPNAVAAINIALIHDTDDRVVSFATSLSSICEILGEWQIWEEVLHLGVPTAGRLGDPLGEIALLSAQTNLARYRREFDRGLELASRVYLKSLESGIEIAIASSANQLACLYMDCGRHDEATPLLEKCLEIYQRLGLEHEIGKVFYNLGTIYRASGKTRKAIECFERDLQACLNSADESGAAETLNTLAIAHFEMGELEEAEKLQRASLEKFKKIGNPHKVSMVSNDLGVTLRRLQKFNEALDLHLADVELCRVIGSRSGEALAQANVAETLHYLGDSESAEARFGAAVSVLNELGDKLRLAHVLIAQAPLLLSVRKIQIAEEYASQAIAILLEYGQTRDAAGAHQLLAREFALICEHEKSLSHAKESIQLSQDFTSPYFRAVGYIIAVEQCLQLHRTEEAKNLGEVLQQLVLENPELVASLGESLDKALNS